MVIGWNSWDETDEPLRPFERIAIARDVSRCPVALVGPAMRREVQAILEDAGAPKCFVM